MKEFEQNGLKIIQTSLDNGLSVVLAQINKAPVVSINITFRVGSKDESPNHTGLAHLFEHLMFEGTKNLGKGEFDKYCSQAGGTNNAYTSYDQTTFYMTLPSNQLKLGLWLESDRLFNHFISKEALETQKKVVVEEISQTVEEQPYGMWRQLLAQNAYSLNSCYSWEVQGLKEHVAKTLRRDINKFFKKFYSPSNACLVICGDFQEMEALDLVNLYFGKKLENQFALKRIILDEEQLTRGKEVTFNDDVPSSAVFQAYHCSGFKNLDVYKAEIISHILGSGRSSRLYKELVYKNQIAGQVGSFLDRREQDSLITIYAIGLNNEIEPLQLNDAIRNVLELTLKNGFENDEIIKTQNKLSTQLAREIQQLSGLADNLAHFTLFNDSPQLIFELQNLYSSFSLDEINDYAKKILNYDDRICINAIPNK